MLRHDFTGWLPVLGLSVALFLLLGINVVYPKLSAIVPILYVQLASGFACFSFVDKLFRRTLTLRHGLFDANGAQTLPYATNIKAMSFVFGMTLIPIAISYAASAFLPQSANPLVNAAPVVVAACFLIIPTRLGFILPQSYLREDFDWAEAWTLGKGHSLHIITAFLPAALLWVLVWYAMKAIPQWTAIPPLAIFLVSAIPAALAGTLSLTAYVIWFDRLTKRLDAISTESPE